MTHRWPLLIWMTAVAIGATAGCGKRGDPKAPIRPVPGPATALSARRVGDQVEIRLTVPTENADHSAPLAITHVDIYAAAGPPVSAAALPMSIPPAVLTLPLPAGPVAVPSTPLLLSRFSPVQFSQLTAPVPTTRSKKKAPPTTAPALMVPKYLRKRIDVQRPPADPEAEADSAKAPVDDGRPKPGAVVTFDEQVATERGAAATAPDVSILRYLVVGYNGKRPGTPAAVIELPLTNDVTPPRDPQAKFDEHTTTLTWTGGSAQAFRVYRTDARGKEDGPSLTPTPLATPTFATPVEFDAERCFVIRSVVVRGAGTTESDPTAPVCVKAVDTFPPAAPGGLAYLPTEDHNQLVWNPVAADDLAGYLVLRSDDGAPARPITTGPLPETSYTDRAIKAGTHYIYTVVAVDKAGNRSVASNAVEDIR